jgi:hypothetical protein
VPRIDVADPTSNLEVLVDAGLDTLATALYVRTDDLLKEFPERAPWRPAIGITPELSDAELLTLAVMQALLGYVSESRWLRYARKSLRGLFPRLPGQSGYNKRLRQLAATMAWMIRVLARDTSLWADDVRVVDSTPVECGRSRDTVRRSDLAGYAQYGYCASHSRWFWGLRLHLLCTLHGLPVAFALAGGRPGLHDNGGPLVHGQVPRLARPVVAGLARDENLARESRPQGSQVAVGNGVLDVHCFLLSFVAPLGDTGFCAPAAAPFSRAGLPR